MEAIEIFAIILGMIAETFITFTQDGVLSLVGGLMFSVSCLALINTFGSDSEVKG